MFKRICYYPIYIKQAPYPLRYKPESWSHELQHEIKVNNLYFLQLIVKPCVLTKEYDKVHNEKVGGEENRNQYQPHGQDR